MAILCFLILCQSCCPLVCLHLYLKQLAHTSKTMELLSLPNTLERHSYNTKKALCFQYQTVQGISTSSKQKNANWRDQGRLSM